MRAAILFLSVLTAVHGFVIAPPSSRRQLSVVSQQQQQQQQQQSRLFLSSSADNDKNKRKRSRLEGNNRPPSAKELSIMDEMIDKLADAKPYDLPNAVQRAFRVISSPQFFMRIAARADDCTDAVTKEKLAALAINLVNTLEAVVSTTEDRLDERAKDVENVVKAAAEPDSGEFLVPLLPERVAAMRSTLQALDESALDTTFLNTIDAWMLKSHEDGMDLMVGILQKALQMYAGTQIMRARKNMATNNANTKEPSAANKLFEQLLNTDADVWDAEITKGLEQTEELTAKQLQTEIQRTMETIVLSLEAGSMAQQVQAEFLQEMVKRVEPYIK
jgi:hypothetical protein